MKLRLSEEEIKVIKETAFEVFDRDVEIILFGSRIDPNRHGGDIDLSVKTSMTPKEFIEKKFEFIYKLWQRIGQQKIDWSTTIQKRGSYQFTKKPFRRV